MNEYWRDLDKDFVKFIGQFWGKAASIWGEVFQFVNMACVTTYNMFQRCFVVFT